MHTIFTTNHGADSMRHRLKTSKSDSAAHALEALDKGLPREETGGNLRRFLDKKYFAYDREGKIVLWRNFIWIFTKGSQLKTCYPMPGNLARDVQTQLAKFNVRKTAPM